MNNSNTPNSANIQGQSAVLISGASTGIGQYCALRLAQSGFQVFAGYRQPEAQEALRALHSAIYPIRLDITSEQSIILAFEHIQNHLQGKPFQGLINNAGIVVGGPLESISTERWREQLEVNLIGHIAVTQAFLPLLRESRGRIISMGSVAGIQTLPFVSPYSVSKFGLGVISDALRVELQPWGIQVALIEPGSVQTPIWEKSRLALETELENWTPELKKLYGPAMRQVEEASLRSSIKGVSPQKVANAVLHALTAKHPKTRYPIGSDAQLRRYFSWLPDQLKDWIILRKLGLS
jgi:NAD(P)-dependent dehydrogenase (short-subunit alcohol dehydrogenase family)